jgi:hypothetical protein
MSVEELGRKLMGEVQVEGFDEVSFGVVTTTSLHDGCFEQKDDVRF